MIAWIRVLAGAALLLLGRRLFWLSVGLLGFAGGALAASQLVDASPVVVLAVALVGGLVGVLLALFLQSLAIGLSGFLAGGLVAINALSLLGIDLPGWRWLPFIVGGIIGAAVMGALFDWALILLTSLAGAGLIVPVLDLDRPASLLAFVGLAVLGLLVQAAAKGSNKPEQAGGTAWLEG